MKNKLFLSIILGLFLISFASASLGTFKQGDCVDIKTILNTTAVTINSLSYPNSSTALGIIDMEKKGLTFNYTFCDTSTLGIYNYYYNDTEGNVYVNNFEVTPSGTTFNISTSILSIFILAILIGLLIFSTKGLFKTEEGGWQIFYICISYVLLFSVFFLLWIFSKNYLFDIPILESVFWVIWLILSVMFFPFIIIVSAYILKGQAEALLEGDYVKQGYTRGEAKEMAKKKR